MSLLQNSNAISAGGYDINNSLRFKRSSSAYLNRTFTTPTNNKIWTWSSWVKKSGLGVSQTFLGYGVSGTLDYFGFNTSDQLYYFSVDSGGGVQRANYNTAAVFRDPSAWYHVVFSVDTTQATASNRFKLYVNGVQQTLTTTTSLALNWNTYINSALSHGIGYVFDGGTPYLDGYLAEVNFIDGQALTPSSFGETDPVTGSWAAKKYTGTYGTNGFYLKFANDSNSLSAQYGALLNGSSQFVSLTPTSAFNFSNNNWTIETFIWPNGTTNQVIFNYGYEGSTNRSIVIYYTAGNLNLAYSTNGSNNTDTSFGAHNMPMNQWHHLAIVRNGTTITAYINGVPLPTTITIGTSSINYPGTSGAFRIGRDSTSYLSAFLHGFRIINGTAAYTSKFKPTTTKLTAITNTQLLTLQDATLIDNSTNNFTLTNNGSFSISFGVVPYASPSIGADYSGNINNWRIGSGWNVNDISDQSYDVMYDSPTLTSATVANYPVLNPLYNTGLLEYLPLSNGNLTATESSGSGAWRTRWSTIGMTSGKWYAEFRLTYAGSTSIATAGTAALGLYDGGTATYVGQTSTTYGYLSNAVKYNNASAVSYGATYANGDIIGIAFDANAGTLTFYKNGTTQGTAYTSIPSGLYYFACSAYWTSPDGVANWHANFGQRPFTYTPPTGFLSLNTYNLPDSTILKGNRVMDATTYTGTGATLSITNAGAFKPDLVWTKGRSNAVDHGLFDSNRGNTKLLSSNLSAAELTYTNQVTAFNSNGFSLGADNLGYSNYSGVTYVGWQWQAGQGSTSSNTSGSITSTVSVNTTAGFSIVTYTGTGANATVGHGLGVAPKMLIVKNRNDTNIWVVYHSGLTSASYFLQLASTAAQTSNATVWNSTAPTSTVFSIGTNGATNQSASQTYVAYCWAEIAGFSKFGSYTGNGSTNGPFIYLGFRPKYLMVKRATNDVGEWGLHDTARDTYNTVNKVIFAHASTAEIGSIDFYDFTANGFKIRSSNDNRNASSSTYIYAAFAENPFKNANAR